MPPKRRSPPSARSTRVRPVLTTASRSGSKRKSPARSNGTCGNKWSSIAPPCAAWRPRLKPWRDTNRALVVLASINRALREEIETLDRAHRDQIAALYREAQELKDIRKHWQEWRTGFEERRARQRNPHAADHFRAARRLPASRHIAGAKFSRNCSACSTANSPTLSTAPRRRAEAGVGRPGRNPPPVRKTHSQRAEGDPPENS